MDDDIPPELGKRPTFRKLSPDEERAFLRDQAAYEVAYRQNGDPLWLWEALNHVYQSGQTVPDWLRTTLFEVAMRGRTDETAERYRERDRYIRRYRCVRDLWKKLGTKERALVFDLRVSCNEVSGGEVGIAGSCESHAARTPFVSDPDAFLIFSHRAFAATLAAAIRSAWPATGGLPEGVPLRAGADEVDAVRGVPTTGSAVGQWRHRSGVQDGVYATFEVVGDAMEEGGSADDFDTAGDSAKRRLGAGL